MKLDRFRKTAHVPKKTHCFGESGLFQVKADRNAENRITMGEIVCFQEKTAETAPKRKTMKTNVFLEKKNKNGQIWETPPERAAELAGN